MGRSKTHLRDTLRGYLEPAGKGSVEPHELIRAYLDASDPKHAFTGRAFETYGPDSSDTDSISGTDLVAVAMLSIELRAQSRSGITPSAAIELDERRGEVAALLARIDSQRELHELQEHEFISLLEGEKSPGRLLHALILSILSDKRAKRWVATHKLLARKRPGLFPVRDQVVSKALGLGPNAAWWRPWWEALHGTDGAGSDLVAEVQSVRSAAGANHLSVLRVLDIMIWTREAGTKALPDDLRKRLAK